MSWRGLQRTWNKRSYRAERSDFALQSWSLQPKVQRWSWLHNSPVEMIALRPTLPPPGWNSSLSQHQKWLNSRHRNNKMEPWCNFYQNTLFRVPQNHSGTIAIVPVQKEWVFIGLFQKSARFNSQFTASVIFNDRSSASVTFSRLLK